MNFLFKIQDSATRLIYGIEKVTPKMNFYDLIDRDMNGKEVKMSDFSGQVLLLVNVASKWGLTKANYTQLPKLADDYGARGLKILAFPCNQFGGQEPGTHSEIIEFVKKFDPDMPEKLIFFEKADVNGANAREVFSYLKKELPNADGTKDVRWNFGKFLVFRG